MSECTNTSERKRTGAVNFILVDEEIRGNANGYIEYHIECLRKKKDAHPRSVGTVEHPAGPLQLTVATNGHSVFLIAYRGREQAGRLLLAKRDGHQVIETPDRNTWQIPLALVAETAHASEEATA